jgi:Endoribonuclease L-PSP
VPATCIFDGRRLQPAYFQPNSAGAVHAGKQLINTEDAPAAVGAYSQAVKAGETLYVSGQVGLIPGVITTCRYIMNVYAAIVHEHSLDRLVCWARAACRKYFGTI